MRELSRRRLLVIMIFGWVIILLGVVIFLAVKNISFNESEKRRLGDKDGVISINGKTDYYGGAEISDSLKHFIERSLYTAINFNTDTVLESGSVKDVTIREGTFQDNADKSGMHRVKYVVDIPSLRQSYIITYSWLDSEDDSVPQEASVLCVTPKYVIYEDFDCTDMYISQEGLSNSQPYAVRFLYMIEGYKGVLSDGSTYTVKRAKDANNETYLRVIGNVCGSQSLVEEAKNSLRTRMEYLDLRPEDYKINFEYYPCGDEGYQHK